MRYCRWTRWRKRGPSGQVPGLVGQERVPVGKSVAKPGFRLFGKPRGAGCQRRRYGGRMPLERGGKLAWNQRQGPAVADLDRPAAPELAAVRYRPLARLQGQQIQRRHSRQGAPALRSSRRDRILTRTPAHRLESYGTVWNPTAVRCHYGHPFRGFTAVVVVTYRQRANLGCQATFKSLWAKLVLANDLAAHNQAFEAKRSAPHPAIAWPQPCALHQQAM